MLSIANLLAESERLLPESESARVDVEYLLCHCLLKARSFLYTWPEYELSQVEVENFEAALARRSQGEPVAHIIGSRDFWDLQLQVNASTLIPRPDTELLIEHALEHFSSPAKKVLDLGTGTGAIALALGSCWPLCDVLAADFSSDALSLAEKNAQANSVGNVRFQKSDWFSEIDSQECFDLIVSNPPYIDEADPHLQQGDVRFEPLSALVASNNGLGDIEQIIAAAPQFLNPNGLLMLEHGYQQAASVRGLLLDAGFVAVSSREDVGGHERISYGLRPEKIPGVGSSQSER